MEIEVTYLIVGVLLFGVTAFLVAMDLGGIMNKINIMLNKGRILKIIFYTPSKTIRTMYLKPKEGFIRPSSGEPYTINKDFLFMDENDKIHTLVYKYGDPAPIDPLRMVASNIDPTMIESLVFLVQLYTRKKSKGGDKWMMYIFIFSLLTLVVSGLGLYLVYNQDAQILGIIKGLGSAATSAVANTGKTVVMR
jgi:hypothetical protein